MMVNVHQAKTHLSKFIARVLQGEEITIARAGRPVARLVPVAAPLARRTPGSARGQIQVAADLDAPLPKRLLNEFYR